MKKIKIIFLFLIGLAILSGCEKKEAEPVLDMSLATAPAITAPATGSALVLTKELADSIVANFTWNAAQYNLTDLEAVKYHLQIDFADSNFANAKDLVVTENTQYSITGSQLNKNIITMGAEPEVAVDFEIRLFAYVNTETNFTDLWSGVIAISITAYKDIVEYTPLYVPGDYQGWNPAEAPKIYDFNNDGVFNGYIYLPEGGTYEFKFTSDPDWDHTNYGYGGEGMLDTDNGAGNLSVPGPGGYMVEVNINNLTWTYELQNWGVIGEWLGWADDIDMDWDADNQYLIKTVEDIPAAENQRFKYRANDDWEINLGAKDPDDGTLVQGGADIPIPEGGTITFILKFTTPEPTYELIK